MNRDAQMLLLEETLRMFGVGSWQGRLQKGDIVFVIDRLWGQRDSIASECDGLRRERRRPNASVDKVVDHFIRVVEAGRVENATPPPHRRAAV